MPPRTTLSDKLKSVVNPHAARKEPLWTGPNGAGPTGGVTQDLLSRFLCCRERFRMLVVEGVKPKDGFNSRTEYGSMWHCCEQSLAEGKDPNNNTDQWSRLNAYTRDLGRRFPFQRDDINHWHGLTKEFFPRYVEYWRQHPDVQDRTPLLQEYSFDVEYTLPSGRKVRLRGKWDSVDLIDGGVYLQENKTKSTIKYEVLYNQLASGFDLQTMLYLVALRKWAHSHPLRDEARARAAGYAVPLKGVRYNVVRRPAHRTVQSALKKFTEDEADNRIGEWFLRFRVEITTKDIERFQRECLDPLLEQLYDWWECITGCSAECAYQYCNRHKSTHFRTPYGIYNPLLEGAPTDLDRLVDRNDMTGLERVQVLYPELEADA
jgi:hypothetical protein